GKTTPVKREAVTPSMRDILYADQAGECNYWRRAIAQSPADFDCDHVVPVKYGGVTCRQFLQLLCVSCHRSKSA
ncbi:unnamed protein product, partial [Ectocarpus sp. 6 AP-2014]